MYEQLTYLTCTDAHYKPRHNDDLIGLGNLTDSHHHSGDDGEDVVEEEGALPVTGWMHLKSYWTNTFLLCFNVTYPLSEGA